VSFRDRVARWPRRTRVVAFAASVLLAPLLALALAAVLTPLPPELLGRGESASIRVFDRGGQLLREVRPDDGVRSRWVPLSEMGKTSTFAVLAAEDRHFFHHPGVDPLSVVRALVLAVVHRRVVSGASTLTMQLARTVRPHPRTLLGKLREMALAIRIEASLSKDAVLEQYMNRVSFGPNLRGMGAASQAYFGKSPRSLSVAEAALLAGAARGPSLYDVRKRPERAKVRRDRVIDRMARDGLLPEDAATRAKSEPLVPLGRDPSFGAPHFVAALVAGDLPKAQPGLSELLSGQRNAAPVDEIHTTIDADLQRTAETEVTSTVRSLADKGVTAASAIVIDTATSDVLAYVGSPDFFDEAHAGQNDGVRAKRQPGSALKPFVYELAMEKLGWDPSTRLPDVDLHLDIGVIHDYAPHDYDGHVRGPVRLREALGNSLNIPAVWTAHEVGEAALLGRLHELGFDSLGQDADYYGPALALGDGEVTLLELARAYATLARRGVDRPLRFVSSVVRAGTRVDVGEATERRVMPALLADLIVDVLKDHDAREASFGERTVLDFPFEVAAKTGTSKGFRDNWTAGFSSGLTVAVWVGNFNGEPMTNVSGITGAGPLFHAILEAAMQRRPRGRLPIGAEVPGEAAGLERVQICPLSGDLAGDDCPHHVSEWRPRGADGVVCSMHRRVRIDRRNGLRAGPGCADSDVLDRVFEDYPPELRAWAMAAERPVLPSDWSPECPGKDDVREGSSEDTLRIAYPLSGARFALDPEVPRELQRIDVHIVVPAGVSEVAFRVDGLDVATLRAPFTTSWKLEGGVHEMVAVAPGMASAAVKVVVRDGP
jgi:penicillin-binding protein 1C